MWGGPEHSKEYQFQRGKYTGAASPIRFLRLGDGGWIVTVGLSGIPVAKGPANSVVEGVRVFRDCEDRYWNRRKLKLKRRS